MPTKPRPARQFVTVLDTEVAAGAPITAPLLTALDGNAEHCREVAYDPDRHTAALAHDHDGVNSEHVAVASPGTPNLLRHGLISAGAWYYYDWAGGYERWVFHGVTTNTAGLVYTASGQWATHVLVDADRVYNSLTVFGARCDLVLSCYMRASAALTGGTMSFGLTSGGKGKDDDSKSYVTGCRIIVPCALLTTSWQRFWAVIPDVAPDFDTAVRFLVQCEESPVGGRVLANLFDVRPGRALDFVTLGYHTDSNRDWAGYGYAPSGGPPPPLDQTLAIDAAVLLGAD